MSGTIGAATGLNLPTSGSTFLDLLQTASFRGIPFKITVAEAHKGRKVAMHDYPFRDGAWAEDLGRAPRLYQFTGYIIGDLAPAMQLALDNATEQSGSGLLIHPTIGAVYVTCLSCSTSVRKDANRVIEVQWRFVEQGESIFPALVIATIIQVLNYAGSAVTGAGASLSTTAGPAPAAGQAPVNEGVLVTASYSQASNSAAADPAALVAMATGLPVSEQGTSFGRYGGGNASVSLPPGTTGANLQAQLAAQRATVQAASIATSAAASALSAATAQALATAFAALTEAVRATMTNPADQVRVLVGLAGFSYSDTASGNGLFGDIAIVRDAVSALARRVALASLARASAGYKPRSYQEAAALREQIADAIEAEMLLAADAGEDAAFAAMRNLRSAVVQDLTARGANLPSIVTIMTPLPMSSLVLSYRLYGDPSRADQLANAAKAAHPAFLPTKFQALAA